MGKLIAIILLATLGQAAAADRAWLAPGRAELQDGGEWFPAPAAIVIRFGNFGSRPALGFVAQEETGLVVPGNAPVLSDVCARTNAVRGAGIVYPSAATDHAYTVRLDKPLRPVDDRVPFIHGCFAYLSGEGKLSDGVERKEEYCFEMRGLASRSVRCALGNDSR